MKKTEMVCVKIGPNRAFWFKTELIKRFKEIHQLLCVFEEEMPKYIYDENGKIKGRQGLIRDITKSKKEIEKQLTDTQQINYVQGDQLDMDMG